MDNACDYYRYIDLSKDLSEVCIQSCYRYHYHVSKPSVTHGPDKFMTEETLSTCSFCEWSPILRAHMNGNEIKWIPSCPFCAAFSMDPSVHFVSNSALIDISVARTPAMHEVTGEHIFIVLGFVLQTVLAVYVIFKSYSYTLRCIWYICIYVFSFSFATTGGAIG